MKSKIKDISVMLGMLIKRSLNIFLKDKMSVFFSLLAPLIVLAVYVLFLADIQVDAVKSNFENVPIDDKLIKNFVDSWMLAGVISVACITVSFSAQNIMIADKERGVLVDILSSPIPRGLIGVAYLISNIIISLCLCYIVLAISFVYMAISGWTLSVSDVFLLLALTLVSVVSAGTLSTLICFAVKTSAQHGAFVGITSAVIGFLIGAYMPLSMFPKAVQYITLFVPGTYSAALFRNLFMDGALEKIADIAPIADNELRKAFSMELDFFGTTIGADIQLAIFIAFTVLTFGIWLVIEIIKALKRKRNRVQIK